MPRRSRFASGNYIYHVLNRAVGRATIFETEKDYIAFLNVLQQARNRVDCRLLSFCVMPNHWHLVLWPIGDDDLSEFMRWLTVTHTQRWHSSHGTSGTGPIYQGRFKSFPVQGDEHFLAVSRYVERNALTAKLVSKAEHWRWGSLWQYLNEPGDVQLDQWPIEKPLSWHEWVNQNPVESEFADIRKAVRRGRPYGSDQWVNRTAKQLRLESTLRPLGRPKKTRRD